jgi:CRISPR/Cas system CSM-associated protein Csm4 (group 5 of RAMP superfamily)
MHGIHPNVFSLSPSKVLLLTISQDIYLPHPNSGEASRNFTRGPNTTKKIKYFFINFYLTIFINDKVFCVIIIKCESDKTKKKYLSNEFFLSILSLLIF